MNTPLMESPYLREQRQFPNEEIRALSNQMDHAYVDIASKVNSRIVGYFPLNFLSITGERWYFAGPSQVQQSLRQVFLFNGAGNIAHNLPWASVSKISPKSYGSFTNGTNWYGVIYGSNTTIAGQVSFYVTPTNIVVQSGVGAPAITSGVINLEFISLF